MCVCFWELAGCKECVCVRACVCVCVCMCVCVWTFSGQAKSILNSGASCVKLCVFWTDYDNCNIVQQSPDLCVKSSKMGRKSTIFSKANFTILEISRAIIFNILCAIFEQFLLMQGCWEIVGMWTVWRFSDILRTTCDPTDNYTVRLLRHRSVFCLFFDVGRKETLH